MVQLRLFIASPWVKRPLNPPWQHGGFFYAQFFQKFLEIFWGGLSCQSFDKTMVDFLNYLLGITEVVG
jgi:hypothetical protein